MKVAEEHKNQGCLYQYQLKLGFDFQDFLQACMRYQGGFQLHIYDAKLLLALQLFAHRGQSHFVLLLQETKPGLVEDASLPFHTYWSCLLHLSGNNSLESFKTASQKLGTSSYTLKQGLQTLDKPSQLPKWSSCPSKQPLPYTFFYLQPAIHSFPLFFSTLLWVCHSLAPLIFYLLASVQPPLMFIQLNPLQPAIYPPFTYLAHLTHLWAT